MTREQLKKLAGDEIFTAGLQFYQNNGVREMPRSPLAAAGTQKQNGLQFIVNDNPRRTVAVRSDARAAVCSCDIYQQEYKENGRRICPHVVAAILYYLASGKADEYFSRVALEAGDSLLSSYEPVIHETQLVLEPTLHVPAPRIGQSGSRLTGQDNSAAAPVTLSLRVGKRRSDMSGRLYAVRSVPKFLRGHMSGQEVEFSKSFTYQPQWMEFTQPQLPLLRLLCEIFTTIEPAERAGYKLVGDARLLPIPPLMMARLLRILSACPFKLAIGDKEFDIDSVKTDDLPLRAALDTVGRDIELTARMESGRPVPLDLDGEFVFLSGEVYSLPPEKRQALFPLIKQMACGVNSFRFQPRQAERVISELLPQLKLAAPVTIGAGLKRRIVNEKLRPKVYLERQGAQSTAGGISARVKFCYGDLEIDPFAPAGTDAITQSQGIEDGFSFYDPDNPTEAIARPSAQAKSDSPEPLQTGERLLMRDAEGERQIIDILSGYGFKVRLGEVHLTGQDEIYEFFVAGVKELSRVCEIYCSDAFRHMTPRKLTPHGRSYISDGKLLLSLGGDMGELPPQELVAILAALRDRKKYFRLHDGSMLSLEEIGDDWLELADAIADAGVVRRQGVLELESYRATYLDSLLHGLSGMETDSSVDDASHLEAPTDPCPAELHATLRPYQQRGFEWLQALYKLHLGGVLADDMGLGKTLQMIAVVLYAVLRDGHMPSLVVAPTTLTYNWLSEIRKFAPQLNVMVLDGSRQKRQEAIEHLRNSSDMDVLITSYPLIRRDGELLSGFKFRFCILDEAQNIKNAQSVGAEAVRQIDALSRFALTGTPMENHPGELWSIFNFVMPGYLLGNAAFMRQHGQGQNAEQLRVKLRPFLLRRLKKDVLPELPDKVEQTIIADPTPEQQNVYKASLLRLRGHVQELMGQREDGTSAFGRNRIEVLSAITELRQICCHPSLCLDGYEGSSGKLELLMDILPTALENGHRVLLFSQFTSMLSIIRDRLTQEGIGWLYLDGQTPAEERISLVERFNSGMEKTPETADVPDVFLISLKAGGSGLNLVGADTVIHYDPWWNPAVEDQATDRVHRIGQTRSVQVLRLITRDTVEQGVLEMSQRKRALFDQVITAGDTIPTQLTEQEILALFQME